MVNDNQGQPPGCHIRDCSSVVERRTHNPLVPGSSPGGPICIQYIALVVWVNCSKCPGCLMAGLQPSKLVAWVRFPPWVYSFNALSIYETEDELSCGS